MTELERTDRSRNLELDTTAKTAPVNHVLPHELTGAEPMAEERRRQSVWVGRKSQALVGRGQCLAWANA